jgi:hypothetical protein
VRGSWKGAGCCGWWAGGCGRRVLGKGGGRACREMNSLVRWLVVLLVVVAVAAKMGSFVVVVEVVVRCEPGKRGRVLACRRP